MGDELPQPPVDAAAPAETQVDRVTELGQEIVRLRFDTNNSELPVVNFDGHTGKDLTQDPEGRAGEVLRIMTKRAEADLRTALAHGESSKFSKYTGGAIPPIEAGPDGRPTVASMAARVAVFRQDAAYLVTQAEAAGIRIPNFDGETGEPIPKDSLRALKEVRAREEAQLEPGDDLAHQLKLGLDALAAMKRMRREDQMARAQAGLPLNE